MHLSGCNGSKARASLWYADGLDSKVKPSVVSTIRQLQRTSEAGKKHAIKNTSRKLGLKGCTIFLLKKISPAKHSVPLQATVGYAPMADLYSRCEYRFWNENDELVHSYAIPGSYEIHNTGAYVDKVLMWRDPTLLEYLKREGVTPKSFESAVDFPILSSRSPALDLALFDLIRRIRHEQHGQHVRLLDHGCTVAEHYDLLDVMLKADGLSGAREVLQYHGLDNAALPLAAARMLHVGVPRDCFTLTQAEGSDLRFLDNQFDLSLSVGVANHVADAQFALSELLRITKFATVLALWTTTLDRGFWATRHNGLGVYFFSRRDLQNLERLHSGAFISLSHRSELDATQPNSYMNVANNLLRDIGESHIVFIKRDTHIWKDTKNLVEWLNAQ